MLLYFFFFYKIKVVPVADHGSWVARRLETPLSAHGDHRVGSNITSYFRRWSLLCTQAIHLCTSELFDLGRGRVISISFVFLLGLHSVYIQRKPKRWSRTTLLSSRNSRFDTKLKLSTNHKSIALINFDIQRRYFIGDLSSVHRRKFCQRIRDTVLYWRIDVFVRSRHSSSNSGSRTKPRVSQRHRR